MLGPERERVALTEIFVALADLATALGVQQINALPGCWEYQIDPQWWVAVNGHPKPIKCTKSDQPIPAFTAYLEYNGWPAGMVDPYRGLVASGQVANERRLLRAVYLATQAARERPR